MELNNLIFKLYTDVGLTVLFSGDISSDDVETDNDEDNLLLSVKDAEISIDGTRYNIHLGAN